MTKARGLKSYEEKGEPLPRFDRAEVVNSINDFLGAVKAEFLDVSSGVKADNYKSVLLSIVRQIDGAFDFEERGFDIALTELLTIMQYPYAFSRGYFQDVQNPKVFDKVVYPLYWMAHVIRLDGECVQTDFDDEVLHEKLDTFDFLVTLYQNVNTGEKSEEEAMEADLPWIANQVEDLLPYHEQLETQRDELRARLEEMMGQEDAGVDHRAELQAAKEECERVTAELSFAHAQRDTLDQEVRELDEKIAIGKRLLQRSETTLQELQQSLGGSAQKVASLDAELASLDKQIQDVESDTAELQKVLAQTNQMTQDQVTVIQAVVKDIEDTLRSLGIETAIPFNPEGGTLEDVVGIDLDALYQQVQEKAVTPDKVEYERQRIEGEHKKLVREEKRMRKELDELKRDNSKQPASKKRSLAELKRELKELEEEASRREREMAEEKRAGLEYVERAKKMARDLQDRMNSKLASLISQVEAARV